MTLLRYCKELYNIKKKLSDIFVLIQERDVWINTDVKQFLQIKEPNDSQKKYLESFFQDFSRLTNKIKIRISKLQQEHPLIGNRFIIDGKVL